jgi:hypothetical protein
MLLYFMTSYPGTPCRRLLRIAEKEVHADGGKQNKADQNEMEGWMLTSPLYRYAMKTKRFDVPDNSVVRSHNAGTG